MITEFLNAVTISFFVVYLIPYLLNVIWVTIKYREREDVGWEHQLFTDTDLMEKIEEIPFWRPAWIRKLCKLA